MQLTLKSWLLKSAVSLSLAASAFSGAVAQTVYNVPSLSDFSGPFASIMPAFAEGRQSVFNWWNTEIGAKLGVKLELKPYDTRYDTAQTASLWPGVLATKPLIGFMLGGPDTAALQQRLPTDKVPMILGSAANGFGWRPNQWVFSMRPTFIHEIAGFLEWYQKNKLTENRPVKFAVFTTEASPSYADIGKGIAAYAKTRTDKVQLIEVVYAELQPADLTLQLRRVLNAGAEVIVMPSSLQQAVAVKRAMQALGKNVPIVYNMHNAPSTVQRMVGGMDAMNGDYEAHAAVIAGSDDTEAKRFYDLLAAKYGMKQPWNSFTAIGIGQALVLVRAVEAGARKSGGDKLTGELMYKTLVEVNFPASQFNGFAGGEIDFSIEAPFPTKDPRVNIGQVLNGKLTTIAPAVPAPKLEKW
jgi:branched-chain amino acid transport system substrate-binding protein